MAKQQQEVVVKEELALAPVSFSAGDAGEGFEDVTSQSFSMPWLQLLQSGSPAAKRSDPNYVEGAQEGFFLLNSTKELFKEGVAVVPVHYRHVFSEWSVDTESARGNFIAEHSSTDPIVLQAARDEKGILITRDGNLLRDTRLHYVLVTSADGTYAPAILGLSSTQIKTSKSWMSTMMTKRIRDAEGALIQAPMYAFEYLLSSTAVSNSKGSWYVTKVGPSVPVSDPAIIEEARSFRHLIKTQQAIINHDAQASEEETTVDAGEI